MMRRFAVALVCLAVAGTARFLLAQQLPGAPIPLEVLEAAQRDGTARVIVRLDAPSEPEAAMNAAQTAAQRQAIAAAQARFTDGVRGSAARVIRQFQTIPYVAVEVPQASLAEFARTAGVLTIEEDQQSWPSLDESAALVGGADSWTAGFDGSGFVVAILDTGVASSHPFFVGKVVAEACFARTGSCPNGGTVQIGAGSAAPCTYSSDCSHGTHVAGIAAGTWPPFSGVAKGAGVVAIQVFTRLDGPTCGGSPSPCVSAFDSDIIMGLEQVLGLRTLYDIAAVNMSLGSGGFGAPCDTRNTAMTAAINNLRAAGIATVVASGNNAFTANVSFPACISSAVSVGSTTKDDSVSSFSNSASFLSLLAPGSDIYSSIVPNGFQVGSGTSMAAPHVAGAWAILKQRAPGASVSEVLSALQTTGRPIADARNGITKPRISVLAALNLLSGIGLAVSDARVSEGNAGTKTLSFTVSMSSPTGTPVAVTYGTADVTAASEAFASTTAITLPRSLASGTPYPSQILVPAGLGPIAKVVVKLHDFHHLSPNDVDVLLVGPGGQRILVMSDAGGGQSASNVMLTFDDSAPSPVPYAAQLTSGTFRPANYDDTFDSSFTSPAPGGPYGTALSEFVGTDPTGAWRLFVVDDLAKFSGSIAGGWSLHITAAGRTTDFLSASGRLTFAPGQAARTVAVTLNGDVAPEASEFLKLVLSQPSGARLLDAEGIGTLVNDDFTDASLSGVSMKAAHVLELRDAINEARIAKGLLQFAFSDPLLVARATLIRRQHVEEMRTALNQAYAAAGVAAPSYSDPVLVEGITPIRAAHIMELRTAVANLP